MVAAVDARTRILAPQVIRGVALLLCVTGIAGMIVTSIADDIPAALSFGLLGATGALALLLVGALVPAIESAASLNEALAAEVEAQVERLLAAGVDETPVRDLVRDAVDLGRQSAGD
ncbi:MAG: hypothetical protein ABGX61_08385 [Acidimicrobiales bacterium]|jgi:hypothetical protein|nr:hypothetical protein [Acidimicrobiia bacterium]